MPLKWEDATNYSKKEPRGTVPPHAWRAEFKGLSMLITRKVWDDTNTFYLICRVLGIDDLSVETSDAALAMARATDLVRDSLQRKVLNYSAMLEYLEDNVYG